MTATAAPPPAPPRYHPVQAHARGGLGEVLIAEDTELRRRVALKRIRHEKADDVAARLRFLAEAEITGRLEHPGVVPVYGLQRDHLGRPCYAMRFITGSSMKSAIERLHKSPADAEGRGLEFRKLLQRFVSVCQTVGFAHSVGVIHRDLKPENVMLGPYGETLVVDWGLAKDLNAPGGAGSGIVPPPAIAPRRVPAADAEDDGPVAQLDDTPGDAADGHDVTPHARSGPRPVGGSSAMSAGRKSPGRAVTASPAVAPSAPGASRSGPTLDAWKTFAAKADEARDLMQAAFGAGSGSGGSGSATQAGSILGTAGYMAPEQADGNVGGVVGPAADIYALGASLYHLLVGKAPLDGMPYLTALMRTSTGQVPPARKVNPAVPAALDAVCRKAMSLKPDDRHATAQDLAADIEAWLADEPVSAFPEPWTKRARRWMRRRPGLVAGGAAAVICVVVASVGWAMLERNQKAALDGLNAELASQNGKLQAANESERRSAEAARVSEAAARQERDRAEENLRTARAAVDESFAIAGKHEIFQRPGLQDARRLLLSANLKYYRQFLERKSDDPSIRADLATAHHNAGTILAELGSHAEAVDALQTAAGLRDAVVAADPSTGNAADRADTLRMWAVELDHAGRRKESEEVLVRATAAWTEVVARSDAEPRHRWHLARCRGSQGVLRLNSGQAAEALPHIEYAMRTHTALRAAHPDETDYIRGVAHGHTMMGHYKRLTGDQDAAIVEFNLALETLEPVIRRDPSNTAVREQEFVATRNRHVAERDSGKKAAALASLRRMLVIREEISADNPSVPSAAGELAKLCYMRADEVWDTDRPEAQSVLDRALRTLEICAARNRGDAEVAGWLVDGLWRRSRLMLETARYAEAKADADRWFVEFARPGRPAVMEKRLAETLRMRAFAACHLGMWDVAAADYRRRLEMPGQDLNGNEWASLVEAQARLGDHVAAEKSMREWTTKGAFSAAAGLRGAGLMCLIAESAERDVGLEADRRRARAEGFRRSAVDTLKKLRDGALLPRSRVETEPLLATLRARADYIELLAGWPEKAGM